MFMVKYLLSGQQLEINNLKIKIKIKIIAINKYLEVGGCQSDTATK